MHWVTSTSASQTFGSITSSSCGNADNDAAVAGAAAYVGGEGERFGDFSEDEEESDEVLSIGESSPAMSTFFALGTIPSERCIAFCAYSDRLKKRFAKNEPNDSWVCRISGICVLVGFS